MTSDCRTFVTDSPSPRRISRRRFLAATSGAAGPMILPSPQMVRGTQANERLRLAVVGMAGYGAFHGFAEATHTYETVAYAVSCDVDRRKAQRVYDLWEKRAEEFLSYEYRPGWTI